MAQSKRSLEGSAIFRIFNPNYSTKAGALATPLSLGTRSEYQVQTWSAKAAFNFLLSPLLATLTIGESAALLSFRQLKKLSPSAWQNPSHFQQFNSNIEIFIRQPFL
jgi:hypothetical protein